MPGWTIPRGAAPCALAAITAFACAGLLSEQLWAAGDKANTGFVVVAVSQSGQRAGAKMPVHVALDAKILFGDADAWIDPSSIKVERIGEGGATQVPGRFDTRDPVAD